VALAFAPSTVSLNRHDFLEVASSFGEMRCDVFRLGGRAELALIDVMQAGNVRH